MFAILLHKDVIQSVESLWMQRSVLPLILREENRGVAVDTVLARLCKYNRLYSYSLTIQDMKCTDICTIHVDCNITSDTDQLNNIIQDHFLDVLEVGVFFLGRPEDLLVVLATFGVGAAVLNTLSKFQSTH